MTLTGERRFRATFPGGDGYPGYSAPGAGSGSLIQAPGGGFFGFTRYGGRSDQGTIYQVTEDGAYSTVWSFQGDSSDGSIPLALVVSRDDLLYGSTERGGAFGCGSIFRFVPGAGTALLHSFPCLGPRYPYALVQAIDGNLYGLALSAGLDVLFRVTPAGQFAVLFDFSVLTSYQPRGLLSSADGYLYGFVNDVSATDLTKVSDLSGSVVVLHTAAGSMGNLLLGRDGMLYGDRSYPYPGSRELFRLTPSGTYGRVTDLPHPFLSLIQGRDGTFFGTTFGGLSELLMSVSASGQVSTLRGNLGYVVLGEGQDGAIYGAGQVKELRGTGSVDDVLFRVPLVRATLSGAVGGVAMAPPYVVRAGETTTWTVDGRGYAPLEYRFYVSSPVGWRVVQDWSRSATLMWTPSRMGTYAVQVWAREVGSTAAWQAYAGTDFFQVIAPAPVHAGSDGAPLEYLYYRYDEATQAWTLARPYSATPTLSWTPGQGDIGRHWLQVWVRRQGATAAYEAWAGTAITWTATPTIGPGPLEYLFWRYDAQSGTWSVVQPYGPSNTYAWTPGDADAGAWQLQVWVRRVGSAEAYDGWSGSAFLIQP